MSWQKLLVCRHRGAVSRPPIIKLWQCLAVLLVLSVSVMPQTALAQLFREVVVFGDSLSDVGNILTLTRPVNTRPTPVSPPYLSGRFSNGPVTVEHLAARWGLTLKASLNGGLNYAFGGAETDGDTRDLFERDIGVVIPSMRAQLRTFLLSQIFDDIDTPTLYVVWGGSNDIRDALIQGGDPLREAREAAENVEQVILDLVEADAVYFLVPNVPDLGLIPEMVELGAETVARATAASVAFNQALTTSLDKIEAEHKVAIARFDVFSRVREVVQEPTAFGVSNATQACLAGDPFDGGTPCADSEMHLFWDKLHPSAVGHEILADFAAAVLPPVVAARGEKNPQATARVALPAQDVPVLQVRLGTGDDPGRLSRVTVDFTKAGEQSPLIRTLRVHLIQDSNANGQRDSGEAELASGEVQWPASTLTLTLSTPLDLLATSTMHLVVTLDINRTTTAAVTPRAATPWSLAPATLLPVVALFGLPRRRRMSRRRAQALWVLLVFCGVLLVSCNSAEDIANDLVGDDEKSAFTVTMPAQGSRVEGSMPGPQTFPPVAITGAEVRVQ